MKARGISFAIESFCNLRINDSEIFERMERVVLAKLDDFNNHYTVKVLKSFYEMGQGTNEIYDLLINKIITEL